MKSKKRKKYLLAGIGYFPDENTPTNGQSIRSESVFNAVSEKVDGKAIKLKYNYWKKNPIQVLIKFLYICANSEIIIIFPDFNAIKILIPFAVFLKYIFGFKLHYVVIGGWIFNFLQEKANYIKFLNKLNGIFVQTEYLRTELNILGVKNIFILRNFRKYKSVVKKFHFYNFFEFVYFSRITYLKGIDNMVVAFDYFYTNGYKFKIDIYGPIDKEYKSRFYELIKDKEYIKYCGVYDALKAPKLLSKYYMQIFPTKFKTEGFPGSILDSFFGGLPVLAANWNSAQEVIKNSNTGLIYNFNDLEDFKRKIKFVLENPASILEMRKNCIIESKKYQYEKVVDNFIHTLLSR